MQFVALACHEALTCDRGQTHTHTQLLSLSLSRSLPLSLRSPSLPLPPFLPHSLSLSLGESGVGQVHGAGVSDLAFV